MTEQHFLRSRYYCPSLLKTPIGKVNNFPQLTQLISSRTGFEPGYLASEAFAHFGYNAFEVEKGDNQERSAEQQTQGTDFSV